MLKCVVVESAFAATMSTVLSVPERSAPDLSPAAPLPPSQPSKPRRVLACVLCQDRKVKCDRKIPCAHCIKSRVQCIPATLAPRRRRPKFPERELLERLRRYEDLLRENNIRFEPLYKDSASVRQRKSPNAEGGFNSDDEQPVAAGADQLSPSTTLRSEGVYEAKYALQEAS